MNAPAIKLNGTATIGEILEACFAFFEKATIIKATATEENVVTIPTIHARTSV